MKNGKENQGSTVGEDEDDDTVQVSSLIRVVSLLISGEDCGSVYDEELSSLFVAERSRQ